MARIVIPIDRIKRNVPISKGIAGDYTNLTEEGGEIVWDCNDEKTLIHISKGMVSDESVIIKAGNGMQGTNDLVITPATQFDTIHIQLDSGRFKNVSGPDAGKVIIEGKGYSFCVVEME